MKNLLYLSFLVFISCSKGNGSDPIAPEITYTLNVSSLSGGRVSTSGGSYDKNSVVTVEAIPDAGYEFSYWTGNANGSDNPLSVEMAGNKNITANFIRSRYTLTVYKSGEGTITQNVNSSSKTTEEYDSGTIVRLNAIAASGWTFNNWSGSESSTSNQLDVTLNQSKSVTATFIEQQGQAQQGVSLEADGPGNTYELITSVLAPGNSPVEAPDCNHTDFGRHIEEVYDNDLSKYVFKFHVHTTPDNDRCINFDRQRNEIKTYDKSPENLIGRENERVTYSWKFKLTDGFQSSPNFSHIHQIKSVGGSLASMPIYTLTTRKGTPDRLELRYAETDRQVTLTQTDLAPFIGQWIEVSETVQYATNGSYRIELRNVSTQEVLLTYSDDSIINWRPGATLARPKWGIYRSLLSPGDLRDESLLFADFNITEN